MDRYPAFLAKAAQTLRGSILFRIGLVCACAYLLSHFTTGAIWITGIGFWLIWIATKLTKFWREPKPIKILQVMVAFGLVTFTSTLLAATTGLPDVFSTIRLPQHKTTRPFVDKDGMTYVYSDWFGRVSKYDQDGTFLFSRDHNYTTGRTARPLLVFPQGDFIVICLYNTQRRLIIDRDLNLVSRDKFRCDPFKTANFERIDRTSIHAQISPINLPQNGTTVKPTILYDGFFSALFLSIIFPVPEVSFGILFIGYAILLILGDKIREIAQ